jgi:hypothetical protein
VYAFLFIPLLVLMINLQTNFVTLFALGLRLSILICESSRPLGKRRILNAMDTTGPRFL